MKQFTTIKVGYTHGIYGCSGEYFTTIIINGSKHASINHYGLYGSEERVNQALKAKGYKEFYTPSDYGKMTKKEVWKGFMSENEAIDKIKKELNELLRKY